MLKHQVLTLLGKIMKGITMKKFALTFIGLAFLGYGLFRTGVSSLLLLHTFELIHSLELQAAIDEVQQFMLKVNPKAIIPASATGYIFYLTAMGLLLIVGGIGCIIRASFAQYSLNSFLALYAALFINFQTMNPKIFHLIICAVLLLIYNKLLKSYEADTQKSL